VLQKLLALLRFAGNFRRGPSGSEATGLAELRRADGAVRLRFNGQVAGLYKSSHYGEARVRERFLLLALRIGLP
jgi:hypothetical protein